MRLYEVHSIADISLIDLDGKELRKIGRACARFRDGKSDKRYIIKKGDRIHVCKNVESFIYDRYRDESLHNVEVFDIAP